MVEWARGPKDPAAPRVSEAFCSMAVSRYARCFCRWLQEHRDRERFRHDDRRDYRRGWSCIHMDCSL